MAQQLSVVVQRHSPAPCSSYSSAEVRCKDEEEAVVERKQALQPGYLPSSQEAYQPHRLTYPPLQQ